jgi:stage II sporulation protein P
MNSRNTHTNKNNFFLKILVIPLFVMLSFVAVKLGMMGGSMLFDIVMDGKVIGEVDTQNFKNTMNKSLPLIDMIYNSGKISVSITDEIINAIKRLSGFDVEMPLTILNAQSSYFEMYYNNSYLPKLAEQEEAKRNISLIEHPFDQIKPGIGKEENEEAPNEKPTENNPPEYNGGKITNEAIGGTEKEPISSISWVEDDEPKNYSEEDSASYKKIALQNQTDFKITSEDIKEMLKEPLNIKFDRKGPEVLIYHTHTSESYLRKLADLNKKDVQSWTQDPKYNVVRVGNELSQHLKNVGIETLHSGAIHDYPDYNSSYVNSLSTLNKYLKSYPSIQITFDVHRDGLGVDDKMLRAVTKINGKDAAQIMFVLGTNQKLEHPNWKENLKLAVKLQEKLNKIAPGLAKPIFISTNRYNQHLRNGSLIVEVGGDGNTLEEAMESTKYLAEALRQVIKQ